MILKKKPINSSREYSSTPLAVAVTANMAARAGSHAHSHSHANSHLNAYSHDRAFAYCAIPQHGRRVISTADISTILSQYLNGADATPKDPALYQRALVHRSCSPAAAVRRVANKDNPGADSSYERLEFLGDAVLSLLTATYLYERYPLENEGFLSRMRTRLINGKALASLCAHTSLPGFVVAQTTALATAPDTLEDVFEAFVGALYLDLGIDVARRWLVGLYEDHVDFAELAANQDTAKSVLNRHCMRNLGFVPKLEQLPQLMMTTSAAALLTQTTDSAAQVAVRFRHPTSGAVISTGYGASLREAEDQAIRRARKHFNI